MFLNWPWENGVEPDFVNEEGFEWYINKGLTKWATAKRDGSTPIEAVVFLVAKDNDPKTYAIVMDGKLVYDSMVMENVACHIDMLRLVAGKD